MFAIFRKAYKMPTSDAAVGAAPRCEKGNPAARRVRKAKDLSEEAGLPNRRECGRSHLIASPNTEQATLKRTRGCL